MSQQDQVILSTYRLQLRPEFTFSHAASIVDYVAELGVSHLYVSPILQAAPGSEHGYDVVDHRYVCDALGGLDGFKQLVAAAHDAGLGIIVDVVPNHMAVPTPAHLNPALWSVLRDGPESPYASWVDVNWEDAGTLLMPVLGDRIGNVLNSGELALGERDGEKILTYHEHEFPVRQGTADLPMDELVDQQWYRLAYWKIADEELNYRRFFDIDTLAAVRVENEDVFAGTHSTLLELVRSGHINGLRIDHPDGLADPGRYLDLLAKESSDTYVVVEKILEGEERLPKGWKCHGTTGYDSLMRVSGLFEHADSTSDVLSLWRRFTGLDDDFADVAATAKRDVVNGSLHAEVERLTELLVTVCRSDVHLRDHSRRGLRTSVEELLIACDRYRAYVTPGEEASEQARATITEAAARAAAHVDTEHHDTLELVRDLALGDSVGCPTKRHTPERLEFVTRFGQTSSPIMAKGVEDTALYRWFPFPARNEVGGDPSRLGYSSDEFHAFASWLAEHYPITLTALSTHDTKRSEDTRAVLTACVEEPAQWGQHLDAWSAAAAELDTEPIDKATEYLLWHTIVGLSSPTDTPSLDRVQRYLTKAVREAKQRTSWVVIDEDYERTITDFAAAVLGDDALTRNVLDYRAHLQSAVRAIALGQKLVQLTMPGVPDIYQGSEVIHQAVVDPDNRDIVDFAILRHMLSEAADGTVPSGALSSEKILVTHTALQARKDFPDAFTGDRSGYMPLAASSNNMIAFARTCDSTPRCVTLATRFPRTIAALGGWGEHHMTLPGGIWRDVLSGSTYHGGTVLLRELFATRPVCLLTATDH